MHFPVVAIFQNIQPLFLDSPDVIFEAGMDVLFGRDLLGREEEARAEK